MRERFKVLFESVRIPRLYGISAMGTKISVYTMDTKNDELFPSLYQIVLLELQIQPLQKGGVMIL